MTITLTPRAAEAEAGEAVFEQARALGHDHGTAAEWAAQARRAHRARNAITDAALAAHDAIADVHGHEYTAETIGHAHTCRCGRSFPSGRGLTAHLNATRRQADAALTAEAAR